MRICRARGIDLADAVSGYAAGLAGWGDQSRVRQILINLLGNAIKFTEARDGEPGRIIVSAGSATTASPDARLSGDGPWVYVRVEDTGPGIPADRLQAIFEPFVQADMTLTRAHGGTGLGLAISRRLARLMGGEVTVRSEMGVGSTFFLWLRAAAVESLDTGGLEGHGPGSGGRSGGAPDATSETARATERPAHTGPMLAVGNALLAELERILHAYVARVRSDPATPTAHTVNEAHVEDHLASFLADLAGTLQHVEWPGGPSLGEPTPELRDGSAIQRIVAERHGAQRARLGWKESELRREFDILREEVVAAVKRRSELLVGPTLEARRQQAERAEELLDLFIGVAERISLAGYHAAREAQPQEEHSG
jgi:hypothetical protein